jgi:hypothetical protein
MAARVLLPSILAAADADTLIASNRETNGLAAETVAPQRLPRMHVALRAGGSAREAGKGREKATRKLSKQCRSDQNSLSTEQPEL